MKLADALRVINKAPKDGAPFQVLLACGVTALHLRTFLQAHLQQMLPTRMVQVRTGLYDDLAGTLEKKHEDAVSGLAVVLEWSDLDPRLGFRSAGAWGDAASSDIVTQATARLSRLRAALGEVPNGIRVAISPPLVPLAPAFPGTEWRLSRYQLELDVAVASFLSAFVDKKNFSVLNERLMCNRYGVTERYDIKSDLATGFPYTTSFSEAVSGFLARCLLPSNSKKGIITDLDDTLWWGIAGDIGPSAVSWSLEEHHQIHGLYQKTLASLGEEGVLLAAASKNNPAVVNDVLSRSDILIDRGLLFPTEVNWGPKSLSVSRILNAWNIAADSVVFVDDSPMELAEVERAHPGITCLPFPKDSPADVVSLLRQLRSLCGKEVRAEEDGLRATSIRANVKFQAAAQQSESSGDAEHFLEAMESSITFSLNPSESDPRVLELVNKTNQFNLNGIRYTEADWVKRLSTAGSVLVVASYRDRFGPLGKIAVLAGVLSDKRLSIDTWVMSCRAFSRRIEHHCLKLLFDHFPIQDVALSYEETPRNGPVQDFLRFYTPAHPARPANISREVMEAKCPELFGDVKVISELDLERDSR